MDMDNRSYEELLLPFVPQMPIQETISYLDKCLGDSGMISMKNGKKFQKLLSFAILINKK